MKLTSYDFGSVMPIKIPKGSQMVGMARESWVKPRKTIVKDRKSVV
jgi:hypothetical protein